MATLFAGSRILDDFGLDSVEQVLSVVTIGGIRVTDAEDWQKWVIRVTLEVDVNGRKGHMVDQVVHRLLTGEAQFSNIMPQFPRVPTVSGSVRLRGAATARDTAVEVDGSSSADIPKGRFFSVGNNDPKVYLAGNAVDVSPSGQSLLVFPRLRMSALNNALLDFSPNLLGVYTPQSVKTVRLSRGVFRVTREVEEVLV